MRVYKFLNLKFGLKTLREKQLKISTVDDLNDPFGLLAYEMTVRKKRKEWRSARKAWEASMECCASVPTGKTRLSGHITATSTTVFASVLIFLKARAERFNTSMNG